MPSLLILFFSLYFLFFFVNFLIDFLMNFTLNFAIIFYYEFDSKITAFIMSIVYIKFNMILSWFRIIGCQNGQAPF